MREIPKHCWSKWYAKLKHLC